MWKILVVDDNFANRQLLVEILREYAVCDTAVNGREALEAYFSAQKNKASYDAILLDIAMPELDGLQFLSLVREQEKSEGIAMGDGLPIIMVTAFQHPFMEAFKRGCDDYILKPVNPAQLLVKLKAKVTWRETI